MIHFLQRLIEPTAILMLFVAIVSIFGYACPGFISRATSGSLWLLWLLLGVLAVIAWIFLVFS